MYVPSDQTLGNPGLFDAISDVAKGIANVAVGAVKGVLGGGNVKVSIPTITPQITITPPNAPITVQAPPIPSWAPTAALGAVGLIALLFLMPKGSRR